MSPTYSQVETVCLQVGDGRTESRERFVYGSLVDIVANAPEEDGLFVLATFFHVQERSDGVSRAPRLKDGRQSCRADN